MSNYRTVESILAGENKKREKDYNEKVRKAAEAKLTAEERSKYESIKNETDQKKFEKDTDKYFKEIKRQMKYDEMNKYQKAGIKVGKAAAVVTALAVVVTAEAIVKNKISDAVFDLYDSKNRAKNLVMNNIMGE